MSKNIIILFDGTSNNFASDTHLSSLSSILKGKTTEQEVYYIPGVGGETRNTKEKITEFVLGTGLTNRMMRGYKILCREYQESDKIYIFGFSRGAYTARSLAGMIYNVGLLHQEKIQQAEGITDKNKESKVPYLIPEFYYNQALHLYQDRNGKPSSDGAVAFRELYSHDFYENPKNKIEFLGLFDTVATLGWFKGFSTLSWVKLGGLIGLFLFMFYWGSSETLNIIKWLHTFKEILNKLTISNLITFPNLSLPFTMMLISFIGWLFLRQNNYEKQKFHDCKINKATKTVFHILSKEEERLAFHPEYIDFKTKTLQESFIWNLEKDVKETSDELKKYISSHSSKKEISIELVHFTDKKFQEVCEQIKKLNEKDKKIIINLKLNRTDDVLYCVNRIDKKEIDNNISFFINSEINEIDKILSFYFNNINRPTQKTNETKISFSLQYKIKEDTENNKSCCKSNLSSNFVQDLGILKKLQ